MTSNIEAPVTPEGSDTQEDLVDHDEDSSLLDTALGLAGDGEPPETPTEEQADTLLDESVDGVQIEEDPVNWCIV